MQGCRVDVGPSAQAHAFLPTWFTAAPPADGKHAGTDPSRPAAAASRNATSSAPAPARHGNGDDDVEGDGDGEGGGDGDGWDEQEEL